MREFDYHKLRERTWDNEILSYIAQIHEHKGRQELFRELLQSTRTGGSGLAYE